MVIRLMRVPLDVVLLLAADNMDNGVDLQGAGAL
jgi:hypothetical protein